ncbi:dual OB domain-containing protein [Paenibacillus sp. JSM ZJ436]|uniref:dual OB domain-containing protein n=1 Tax=Paenibacillus sp. JSM ZJ436 TaxID=3376190 RepID=UPI0037BDD28E
MNVKIVLLTKSRKYNNYCVAGIDFRTGKWIRLVSSQADIHCAVPEVDLTYENGTQAEIFDVIEVQLTKAAPQYFQPENYEYDSEYYWRKVGVSSLEKVKELVNQNVDSFVFHNSDKRLLGSFVSGLTASKNYSLKFVFVKKATLVVEKYETKIKHKLSFTYNGITYNDLSVTDDAFIRPYQNIGSFDLNNVGLVISLGEIFKVDQCHYKLVAAVIH